MKILVIDDEALAIEAIVNSLNRIGYHEILQASNGEDALRIVETSRPAVVLADICMPGMDGISIFSAAKKRLQDILFVFISGYDYFEYAREALALGAFNYLLKPVKDHELLEVMKRVEEKLEAEKNLQEKMFYSHKKASEGSELLRRHFLSELVTSNALSGQYVNAKLRETEIEFLHDKYCTIIINVEDQTSNGITSSLEDNELLFFCIENIATELLSIRNIVVLPFTADHSVCYLVNLPHSVYTDEILGICKEIKECVYKYLRAVVTIGMGKFADNINELPLSFTSAKDAVSQKLVKGTNQVYYLESDRSSPDSKITSAAYVEKELLQCFERCDIICANSLVKKLYAPFKEVSVLVVNDLMKTSLRLILTIFDILNRFKINPEDVLGDEFVLYNEVKAFESIDLIMDFFDRKLTICIEAVKELQLKTGNKPVELAKSYIQNNYTHEITVEMVAGYVNLSPSYLSTSFRKAFGISIIEYIINLRISKAKELLKEGRYKATEVCQMVGFYDSKHFYKIFKKYTSFTPSEYKNLYSG